ncbi:MAG: ester cyclase [Planktomarina sp.]
MTDRNTAPWATPEEYILGITRAIWEDRQIGSLTQYYAPDLIVRSPASIVQGNQGIIAATMATLAEMPDRELLGEDVIWTPGQGGFLSSHRLMCLATHSKPGMYGAPTGRKLAYRIIADCFCRGGAVHDEWLVRDQSAIVKQLGFDVQDWTRDLIHREGGPEACVQPFHPKRDFDGPYTGRGNDNAWGQKLADTLMRIMSAEFSAIPEVFDRAAGLFYPGGETAYGWASADQFWLGLRAAFPSASFEIHHVIGGDDELMCPRAAVRWSLTGRHDGHGQFGTPTGADVHVMGMTHVDFGPFGSGGGTIRKEYTLIDETAIWKQILLATGAI